MGAGLLGVLARVSGVGLDVRLRVSFCKTRVKKAHEAGLPDMLVGPQRVKGQF